MSSNIISSSDSGTTKQHEIETLKYLIMREKSLREIQRTRLNNLKNQLRCLQESSFLEWATMDNLKLQSQYDLQVMAKAQKELSTTSSKVEFENTSCLKWLVLEHEVERCKVELESLKIDFVRKMRLLKDALVDKIEDEQPKKKRKLEASKENIDYLENQLLDITVSEKWHEQNQATQKYFEIMPNPDVPLIRICDQKLLQEWKASEKENEDLCAKVNHLRKRNSHFRAELNEFVRDNLREEDSSVKMQLSLIEVQKFISQIALSKTDLKTLQMLITGSHAQAVCEGYTQLWLPRHKLIELCIAPDFEKDVVNHFVGVVCKGSQIPMFCKIMGVLEASEKFEILAFEQVGESRKSKKKKILQVNNGTNTLRMILIDECAEAPPTRSEVYEYYKRSCLSGDIPIPPARYFVTS